MKIKNLSIAAAAPVAAFTIWRAVKRYQQWKQAVNAHLQAGSSTIETALGTVEYKVTGQGPAVLIAHGSPGGYDQSVAFARLIDTDQLAFISVSRPGYLRTPLASGKTTEAQADLYAALLDALHIDKAAIIGISGGGPSSLLFALRHHHRCTGLILVSALSQRHSESEAYRALSPDRRISKWLNDRLVLFAPFICLLIVLAKYFPHRPIPQDLLESISTYHLRKTGNQNDMEQFERITPYPLEQVAIPTCILHSTADTDVPFASAAQLAKGIPGAKLLKIEGGGHMSFISEREKVMPELKAFLLELPAAYTAKES